MKHIRWFLVVAVMCIFAGSALAAPVVRVESVEVSEGDVFTVNITVDPAGDGVMGVQYELLFNNTLLNATLQTKGAFLSQDGVGTSVYKTEINNTIGIVKYGETRIGVDYGVTNIGILTTITFRALAAGTSSLNLSKVKLSDPSAGSISNISVITGTCNIKAIKQTPPQTPTPEPTATTPAQIMRTPDANQTPSTPPQSPNASTIQTAMQTPVTTQTTPSEPKTISTTPSRTIHTPAEKRLPGFAASFTIALTFVAFIIMRRR